MVGQKIGRLIINNGDDINAKGANIFVYHEGSSKRRKLGHGDGGCTPFLSREQWAEREGRRENIAR
jgi:hypothetical protein